MRPLAKDDPREIGPFRIIGLLGGGGMGRVYLGRSADGRTVAVKTARSELADDPGFRARFAREVAAARRVGGPFVATVADAAPHDEVPWMATEYVPGVSLSDAVRGGGPLPEPAVRLLTAGLLHALTAVHAHGLVHRDLKPSNVLLTAEGPRVIDFGIAHSAADTALTVTGTTLGTPGFMAPEQLVMAGPPVTGAADVFALGGVIVFAATGSGPFGTAEPQVLMYRTVHEQPRLDGLPGGLREVAADCLVKEPERRPALPALMARLDAPGRYGDWLPEPVAGQLRRLSERLGDPRSPETSTPRPGGEGPAGPGSGRPATGTTVPSEPPPPPYGVPSPSPAGVPAPPPPATLPQTPYGSVPAAAPQGSYGPAPAAGPPGGTPAPSPLPPPAPGQSASPGPTRRRALAALAVAAGVAGGGGALMWVLGPDGGDGGSGGTGAGAGPGGTGTPSADAPSAGSRPSGNAPAAGAPSRLLPREIRDKGVLTVGSDLAYAPMEFRRAGGEAAGVDIDLAQALGRALGVRVEFENSVFDALLVSLNTGRFDLVMSAMVDTRDRQEGRTNGARTGAGVDMIDYFSAGLALVVRAGDRQGIGKAEDLSGRVVAVQRGTVAHDYLDGLNRRAREKVTVRQFASVTEVYADVAKGRSAACLDDYPVAAYTAATHSGGGALELAGAQIEPVPYGIAVAKDGTALRDAVREALDGLIRSGEYARILKKWHVEDGAVERAVVNGGR